MTQTTTWELVAADYSNTPIDTLDNVVTRAHWQCLATDDTKPGMVGRVYGAAQLDPPDPASFTPQTSLTKAQIIGWVQSKMGADQVTAYQNAALADLNRKINPPTTSFVPSS